MARKRRRRRRKDKGHALRAHSFRRAVERYNLDLTPELREEIVGKIQSNKSKPVEQQSLRVSVHDVTLDSGQEVRVAYDRSRKQLITFLYKDPADYLVTGEQHEDWKQGPGPAEAREPRQAGSSPPPNHESADS